MKPQKLTIRPNESIIETAIKTKLALLSIEQKKELLKWLEPAMKAGLNRGDLIERLMDNFFPPASNSSIIVWEDEKKILLASYKYQCDGDDGRDVPYERLTNSVCDNSYIDIVAAAGEYLEWDRDEILKAGLNKTKNEFLKKWNYFDEKTVEGRQSYRTFYQYLTYLGEIIWFKGAVSAGPLQELQSLEMVIYCLRSWADALPTFKVYYGDREVNELEEWEDFLLTKMDELTEDALNQRSRFLTILAREIQQEYLKNGKMGESYDYYLSTPEWKKTREKKLLQADGRCELVFQIGETSIRCPSRTNLQVHHKNNKAYQRIPDEWDSDLIVLCEKHHAELHKGCL